MMYVGLLVYEDGATANETDVHRLADYLQRQGEEVDVVPLPARGTFRRLLVNFSFIRREWLLAADFDVLLQDESVYLSFYRLNERLRGAVSYPIIAVLHSEGPPSGWRSRLWRRYLRSVDALLFTSRAASAAAQSLIGERPSVTVDLGDETSLARAHRLLKELQVLDLPIRS